MASRRANQPKPGVHKKIKGGKKGRKGHSTRKHTEKALLQEKLDRESEKITKWTKITLVKKER